MGLSIRYTLWCPCISGQTTRGIFTQFGGYIHCDAPKTWLTFGYAPTNFHCSLACDWWSRFRAFAENRWSDWAQILWTISLWASPGVINFCPSSTEFPPFPVSCWSGSFHAFEDKLLIRLGSNIMCQLIMNLHTPDLILVTPHWISTVPCPSLW